MHNAVLVGETIAGESAKTRAQLESLINNVNKQQFDVAELLHKVKVNNFYEPFNTFQEYLNTLNIKARKGQYLVRMVEVMTAVGIERKQYEPLGTARMREITSLDPNATWTNPETKEVTPMRDFILGFIEKGEEIEMDTLKQHVRTLKGFTGSQDMCWLNLSVTRSTLENTIRPALELAKNHIGSVGKDEDGNSKDASDGKALEVIAIEFLNDPSNNVLPEDNG